MRHDFRVLLRSTLLEAANHNYEAHHMLITNLDMDDGPMDRGPAELDPYRWVWECVYGINSQNPKQNHLHTGQIGVVVSQSDTNVLQNSRLSNMPVKNVSQISGTVGLHTIKDGFCNKKHTSITGGALGLGEGGRDGWIGAAGIGAKGEIEGGVNGEGEGGENGEGEGGENGADDGGVNGEGEGGENGADDGGLNGEADGGS